MKDLDPNPYIDADTHEWNVLLWICKREFSELYKKLISARRIGFRLVEDQGNRHGFRLAMPQGCSREEREELHDWVMRKFGDDQNIDQALSRTRCMLQGIDYKFSLDEIR